MSDYPPVFVAMIADRHSDTEPYLFETAADAIAFARRTAEQLARDGQIEESDINGWLWYASWGPEGDSAWVLEKGVGTQR